MMYYKGSWTQWSLGIVAPETSTLCGGESSFKGHLGLLTFLAKVCKNGKKCMIFIGLGHNDPWVDSLMSPDQVWDQV